jgi:hypothetical protein
MARLDVDLDLLFQAVALQEAVGRDKASFFG